MLWTRRMYLIQEVEARMPQSSVWGPVLFSSYKYDIFNPCKTLFLLSEDSRKYNISYFIPLIHRQQLIWNWRWSLRESVESNTLNIIGIFHAVRMKNMACCSHRRHVGGPLFLAPLLRSGSLCSLSPSFLLVTPVLVKIQKSQLTADLNFFLLFSHFWNCLSEPVESHSSHQGFRLVVYHHLMSTSIPTCDLFQPG